MVLFLKHNLPTIDPGLCTGISEVLICGEGGVKGRALPLCAAVIQLPLLKKIIPTWATTYLPVVSVIFTDINDKIISMISDLILTGTIQGSNEECREVMSALYRCGATKTSEREVDNFEDIDNVLNESEDSTSNHEVETTTIAEKTTTDTSSAGVPTYDLHSSPFSGGLGGCGRESAQPNPLSTITQVNGPYSDKICPKGADFSYSRGNWKSFYCERLNIIGFFLWVIF